jgi:membrane protease YdiL (CAAX protease family)
MTSRPHATTIFLLMAVGGAWSLWGLAWLLGAFDAGPTSLPAQAAVALGAFSPALAAWVVRRWVAREGVADAGLGLHVGRGWPHYVFGWLLPLPVVGAIAGLAAGLGLSFVHTDLPPEVVLGALLGALVLTPLTFGEEFGWRGYLQVRWFRHQPLTAAVMTGLVWGVFHYPVILLGFEGYENVALGLVVFPVFTVLLSAILGWLRQRTGSIWAGCLAHAAANTTGGSLTAYLFYGGGQWLLTSYAGVLAWLPLGGVCAWILLTRRLEQLEVQRAPSRLVVRSGDGS